MRLIAGLFFVIASLICPLESSARSDETVAVIGTGDMGDSLGPRLAEIGYRVVYGSRDPSRESVRQLVLETGSDASATEQKDAAQSASIVLLAVGWPAMIASDSVCSTEVGTLGASAIP